MKMFSEVLAQLVACFLGWQIGKYIALKLASKRAAKANNKKEDE